MISGVGRNDLLRLIENLENANSALMRRMIVAETTITELQTIGSLLVESRQAMRENIAKHLAQRGRNDLATEVRAMHFDKEPQDFGLLVPGWTCVKCGIFTGDMKGRSKCRACGTTRVNQ